MIDKQTAILATLLLQLKLEDTSSAPTSDAETSGVRKLLAKKRRSQFKFLMRDAVQILASSNFQRASGSSHAMSKEEAIRLMHEFILARLIHCPADRTLGAPVLGSEFQPTAKGIAVLAEQVRNMGIDPETVPILNSPYNTMKLVHLERSPATGKLLMSGAVAMMVWYYMLGVQPQVFARAGRNLVSSDVSSFSEVSVTETKDMEQDTSSPYYHKYFTHPSTNSISQYWNAEGVRVFQGLMFQEKQIIDYTMTGKALWQWILECTTVQSPAEATQVARLVLSEEYVCRIRSKVADSVTCGDDMPEDLSRETFYMFTEQGKRICQWGDLVMDCKEDESTLIGYESAVSLDPIAIRVARVPPGLRKGSFGDILTLDIISREPGLKMLFRRKLKEWHCDESLMLLDEFNAYLLLREALSIALQQDDTFSSTRLTERIAIALVRIKDRFITVDSPYEVNITSELRDNYTRMVDRLRIGRVPSAELQILLGKVVYPLEAIMSHVTALLEDLVMRFAKSDELIELPFRSYMIWQ